MYASKVEAHYVRRPAERLGKDYDKAPKGEAQSFAQALSSSEASSSKTKGKASAKALAKATDKQEKPNQYCNIIYLPGSKNNNRAATMAAHAKSQWGLDLTEVSSAPNKNKNTKNISSSKALYYINLFSFN